tara:strand:- start:77 stop:235 length:159 start_codon:yes stop_codon:yes gene_type:complete
MEYYTIHRDGKVIFERLGKSEYFERMEDLAMEFYQTGSPTSEQLRTEIIVED